MRAPGENPGMFAIESAMDELANALKIDPVQLRLINHADKNPIDGKPWSSKSLKECFQQAADRFGWSKRNPEPRSMRNGRSLIGWGMATATYPAHRSPASARATSIRSPRITGADSAARARLQVRVDRREGNVGRLETTQCPRRSFVYE